MSISAKDIAVTLSKVVESCKDAALGYGAAADLVQDAAISQELREYSQRYAIFAEVLNNMIEGAGHAPPAHGSLGGVVQRGWMNLSQAVSMDRQRAVLAACEGGADAGLKEYTRALAEALPAPVAEVLTKQYRVAEAMRARIHALLSTGQ